MTTFGIIGTAGRRTDFYNLNLVTYTWMKTAVWNLILETKKSMAINKIRLVSGGAAWADHIAVALYIENKVDALSLHLPALFAINAFEETEDGRIANYYHRKFGSKCYMQENATLKELNYAISQGASVTINKGFKERNELVAIDADYMIALTYGNGPILKSGGTAHTMSIFLARGKADNSWHINLNDRITYHPAQVFL